MDNYSVVDNIMFYNQNNNSSENYYSANTN